MRYIIASLLFLSGVVSAGTQAKEIDPYSFLSSQVWKGKKYPRLVPSKLPSFLIYKSAIAYTSAPDKTRRDLDILYHVDHKTVKRAAIVIVHGGGWKFGDRTKGHELMAIYAAQGYVTVSINYRLSYMAIAPAAVYDTKLAVRWMRANADKYGIDPERVGCAGGSAGGHLSAMLAVSDQSDSVDGPYLNEFSSKVKCSLILSGIFDFRGPDPQYVDPFLGGAFGNRKKGLTEQMSPTVLIRAEKVKTIAPMLIVHSDNEMVPLDQFEGFVAALKKIGRQDQTILLKGKEHGHSMMGLPNVRKASDQFFAAHLKPQPPVSTE